MTAEVRHVRGEPGAGRDQRLDVRRCVLAREQGTGEARPLECSPERIEGCFDRVELAAHRIAVAFGRTRELARRVQAALPERVDDAVELGEEHVDVREVQAAGIEVGAERVQTGQVGLQAGERDSCGVGVHRGAGGLHLGCEVEVVERGELRGVQAEVGPRRDAGRVDVFGGDLAAEQDELIHGVGVAPQCTAALRCDHRVAAEDVACMAMPSVGMSTTVRSSRPIGGSQRRS